MQSRGQVLGRNMNDMERESKQFPTLWKSKMAAKEMTTFTCITFKPQNVTYSFLFLYQFLLRFSPTDCV